LGGASGQRADIASPYAGSCTNVLPNVDELVSQRDILL
jgi:hypothetical protein